MSMLGIIALLAAGTTGTRILLLLVVLIAVVLILAGGAIAVLTFYNQSKAQVAGPDDVLSE
ncbi:MAG TPA: hypothetical protein VKR06_24910 [Ktedonosporobacter sp.]|nr:hypothetical protein [Ktedonosporobacter sp.]